MGLAIDISILICTHNSAARLDKTLSHIKAQEGIENISVEVLIVDYASSDDTLGVAKRLWSDHNIPLRLISEQLPGKTPALETGFRQAKGVGVCIVDDDNWIKSDYVFLANKILKENSCVGIIGAYGLAHCEVEPPDWFFENQSSYAVGHQCNESGYVNDVNRLWFWGAGSVFRRAAWIKAKDRGFIPLLNPSRGSGSIQFKRGFTGGEDPELCYAIQLMGYRLWYEGGLIYTHHIPEARLTKEYINDTSIGVQAAAPIVRLYLSELSQNLFVGKFRKFVYQRWALHLLYICFIYQKTIWITCLSKLKDKSLRISVVNKSYISQLRSLWHLRKDFDLIVNSIRRLKSGTTWTV
jgi:glycosyltransferase involved in cell wall biosynthesis